jgi:hypothetical protein
MLGAIPEAHAGILDGKKYRRLGFLSTPFFISAQLFISAYFLPDFYYSLKSACVRPIKL